MSSISAMEWNAKSPSPWEWNSTAVLNVNKKSQPTEWVFGWEEGIKSVSGGGSGGSGSSSDPRHDFPSKSLKSASFESLSTLEAKITTIPFEIFEGFPKDLKLGKGTCFEDSSVAKDSLSKRSKSTSSQLVQETRCQVEGCNLDLSSAKDYHRRHRVCERHTKFPKVKIGGFERRFCQQCSRFHNLSEFDEKKRSCRRRLSDHNARRRKPHPKTSEFNAPRMSSSLYGCETGKQMNLVFNRDPLDRTSPTSQSTCGPNKGYLLRTAKAGGIDDGQLHLPNPTEWPNAENIFSFERTNGLIPSKEATAQVLDQGYEGSRSNSNGRHDLGRALSLLSTNNQHLIYVNHNSAPTLPVRSQVSLSQYWTTEQHSTESWVRTLASPSYGTGHLHDFHTFKTPEM